MLIEQISVVTSSVHQQNQFCAQAYLDEIIGIWLAQRTHDP